MIFWYLKQKLYDDFNEEMQNKKKNPQELKVD